MIQSKVADGVRLLTLDRPEALNAFNTNQFELLAERMLEAQIDDATKVVVLTGKGRAFSSGADLREDRPTADTLQYGFQGAIDILIDFPKPFVLAVNGIGVGIGATICGLADMAFMAASARLRCPFSALGLTAEACSTYTFPAAMGYQSAARLLLGAQWLDANACKAAGLILDVYPDEGFLERVLEEANALAQFPMTSLIATKALMMDSRREAMKRANRQENEELASLRGGPANLEAIAAFRGKREPDFSDI